MIIFTSDNGPEKSWQQRIKDFDHRSNANYRGGKRDIYEGGHRVPFFVRWPNGINNPGRTWDGLVGQVDILATLASLHNFNLPDQTGEDSQSFLAVLTDSATDHERLPLINHGANGRFSITDGTWKLIMPHRKSKAELYNLSGDPSESLNVIDDHPELVEELTRKITRIVCSGRTIPGPRSANNDTGYWNDLIWLSEDEYVKKSHPKAKL